MLLLPDEILETINMISMYNLDVRTVTMGISLLDCIDPSAEKTAEKIYNKIVKYGKNLVEYADEISSKYNVPIVNKRVSVTPIAIIGNSTDTDDYTIFAKALDRAATDIGIDFIGYNFFPTHTLLRKSIKQNLKRKVRRYIQSDDIQFKRQTASHYGWAKHCDSKHLLKKIMGNRLQLYEKSLKKIGNTRFIIIFASNTKWRNSKIQNRVETKNK